MAISLMDLRSPTKLALALGLLAFARAQAPEGVVIRTGPWFPPSRIISVNTNLVELAATVRDRKGQAVAGLKRENFEVLDKGRPQTINVFSEKKSSPVRPAPTALNPSSLAAPPTGPVAAPRSRSIALFFDDAHAGTMAMKKSADAAERLFNSGLNPRDLIAIFTSSGKVSVDFTNDRAKLVAALHQLRPRPLEGNRGAMVCPTLNTETAHIIWRHLDIDTVKAAMIDSANCRCPVPVTAKCIEEQRPIVEDAAFTVWNLSRFRSSTALDILGIIIRHLAAAPEERLLVLMSPGFPTGGMDQSISHLVDSALRANIRISAVNSDGLTLLRPAIAIARNEFMGDVTESTGGKFIRDNNDISGALEHLTAVPEVSYLLGFSPAAEPDGQYHPIKTRVAGNPGYTVESRPGYFAAAIKNETGTAQEKIDRAEAGADRNDFPVLLEIGQKQSSLNVTIAVPVSGLRFPEREQKRIQELTFLTVLEDARGAFIEGKQSVMDMELSPERFAVLQKAGIRAVTSFTTAPGAYRVREIVREAADGRIWAATSSIVIR